MGELLTRTEAAKAMRICTRTLDRMIARGDLPVCRPSPNRVLIPRTVIERRLEPAARK